MLFVEGLTAEHIVDRRARLTVLEALEARGRVPLFRSARRHCFEQALAGEPDAGRAGELELAVAGWQDAEGDEPYIRGELFCADDHACFLLFGEPGETEYGLRAGLVYTAETTEPERRLEAFCRDAREAVVAATRADGVEFAAPPSFEWRAQGEEGRPESGARTAGGGNSTGGVGRGEGAGVADNQPQGGGAAAHLFGVEGARVAEVLEDAAARSFLLRLVEAQAGSRAAEPGAAVVRGPEQEALVTRLAGAGLVRREVQVSCRKEGRSLFRLPSAEALAIVTASNAVCSECGRAIADERAEELLSPTPLAASLLKGGAWLVSRMRGVLDSLGVPARAVSELAGTREGEARLVAGVCGERLLFFLSDGEFTAAQARHALEAETETQAARLVVVSTGRVHDDARARLREFARRRTRAGGEAEVLFVEGVERAAVELAPLIERVTQQALSRELFALDAAAGFDVGHMLASRFAIERRAGALESLAASAAGALAGSLGEL
ncbi:MAG TPA: hypothetical protein VEY09_02635 [Pyrinomonadaceae bacterium]|nr:hypothetical protein [Pyrinomonadaceae bacterium]